MTEPTASVRKPFFWEVLFTWKRLRRCVIVLACGATFIALFYAVENWRGKRAWNQVRAEWEPKGEKFGIQAYLPTKVPDDQNAVMIPTFTRLFEFTINPTNGSKQLKGDPNPEEFNSFKHTESKQNKMRGGQWRLGEKAVLEDLQEYYRQTNHHGKYDFPISDKPQKPGEDILLALSRSDAAVNTLKESFKTRPYAQFPVPYQDGLACVLPHLGKIKGIAQLLRPRSLAELSLNQNEKAFDDIMLSFHLVDSLRTEPILISQLVRISMLELSIQPIWEGLANHQWNDEQLVSMDGQFAKIDFLSSYKLALSGERTFCTEYAIDSIIQHGIQSNQFGGVGDETMRDQLLPKIICLTPSGWLRQNEAIIVQYLIKMGNVMDAEHHAIDFDSMAKLDKEISAISARITPYRIFLGMLLPSVNKAFLRFSQAQVTVDLARVACNLERYRLANGKYPESLDGLVPKFMAKVPNDLMSGKPLHYKTKEDGTFELYSVGADRVDNGGKVGMTGKKDPRWDPNSGDWVWRY